jgi:hypothetical protein
MATTRTKNLHLTEQPRPWAAGMSDACGRPEEGPSPGHGADRYQFRSGPRPPGTFPVPGGADIR